MGEGVSRTKELRRDGDEIEHNHVLSIPISKATIREGYTARKEQIQACAMREMGGMQMVNIQA